MRDKYTHEAPESLCQWTVTVTNTTVGDEWYWNG